MHVKRGRAPAPGIAGVTFEAFEASGVEAFLQQIWDGLVTYTCLPRWNRRQAIPKDGGQKVRVLSIPAIRARVVQGALKLIQQTRLPSTPPGAQHDKRHPADPAARLEIVY